MPDYDSSIFKQTVANIDRKYGVLRYQSYSESDCKGLNSDDARLTYNERITRGKTEL